MQKYSNLSNKKEMHKVTVISVLNVAGFVYMYNMAYSTFSSLQTYALAVFAISSVVKGFHTCVVHAVKMKSIHCTYGLLASVNLLQARCTAHYSHFLSQKQTLDQYAQYACYILFANMQTIITGFQWGTNGNVGGIETKTQSAADMDLSLILHSDHNRCG